MLLIMLTSISHRIKYVYCNVYNHNWFPYHMLNNNHGLMIGNKWKPILTFVQYIYVWESIYVCVSIYIYVHILIYILVTMYYHVEIDLFMVIYNTVIYIYHCTTMKGHWFILWIHMGILNHSMDRTLKVESNNMIHMRIWYKLYKQTSLWYHGI